MNATAEEVAVVVMCSACKHHLRPTKDGSRYPPAMKSPATFAQSIEQDSRCSLRGLSVTRYTYQAMSYQISPATHKSMIGRVGHVLRVRHGLKHAMGHVTPSIFERKASPAPSTPDYG